MYKVDLPVDRAKDMAIERRRSAEAARKDRIFNARSRVIGIDVSALQQQVEEKKQRQYIERQRDNAFEELAQRHAEALLQKEKEVEEKRAALNRDLTQYWATYQRVEDSRDADLKCNLKGALQLTIPEDQLGPASMQVFMGEDLTEKQRRKAQVEKAERDLRAQKEDREKRLQEERHKEVLMDKELVQQGLRAVQLEALEEECKNAFSLGIYNYNRALAAEQAENLRKQRMKEEGQALAEMVHMVTSDLLTETPEASVMKTTGGGPPKILIDRWKGMTPEQLSVIYREREQQHLERQKQLEMEKALEATWDLQTMKLTRVAEEEDRRVEEQQKERRIQLVQMNKQLAQEQQAHQEYLNKQLYTNTPTVDFFGQFNTSSR